MFEVVCGEVVAVGIPSSTIIILCQILTTLFFDSKQFAFCNSLPKYEKKGVEMHINHARTMKNILAHAQSLVYTLLSLMPSVYQQENLEAMLGLFLTAQGYPLPEHSKSKSNGILNRFLNIYNWSTLNVIRTIRNRVIQEILSDCPKGRQPFLQVIIDLTTLEKCGKFKGLSNLIHVYHGKRL